MHPAGQENQHRPLIGAAVLAVLASEAQHSSRAKGSAAHANNPNVKTRSSVTNSYFRDEFETKTAKNYNFRPDPEVEVVWAIFLTLDSCSAVLKTIS